MGTRERTYPLNITSIILQATSQNLKGLIEPLTTLDNILTNCRQTLCKITSDSQCATVLGGLFGQILSGKDYNGNQYIWNTFNAFILSKKEIHIDLSELCRICKDNAVLGSMEDVFKHDINNINNDHKLLRLLLYNTYQTFDHQHCYVIPEDYKECHWIKEENQNLPRRDLFRMFKNVTQLRMECYNYPLSLKSLLSLIVDTKLDRVEISGTEWLSSRKIPSYGDLEEKYKAAGFMMEFTRALIGYPALQKITLIISSIS